MSEFDMKYKRAFAVLQSSLKILAKGLMMILLTNEAQSCVIVRTCECEDENE